MKTRSLRAPMMDQNGKKVDKTGIVPSSNISKFTVESSALSLNDVFPGF